MNRFDSHIKEYLQENKEVALDKIGTIKIGSSTGPDAQSSSIEFKPDKKISTSPELIDYIAAKDKKNKYLISSDLDSYLSQVREFINIGKSEGLQVISSSFHSKLELEFGISCYINC